MNEKEDKTIVARQAGEEIISDKVQRLAFCSFEDTFETEPFDQTITVTTENNATFYNCPEQGLGSPFILRFRLEKRSVVEIFSIFTITTNAGGLDTAIGSLFLNDSEIVNTELTSLDTLEPGSNTLYSIQELDPGEYTLDIRVRLAVGLGAFTAFIENPEIAILSQYLTKL